jgi:hypothetical protein
MQSKHSLYLYIIFFFSIVSANAQDKTIVAGPMLGQVELRTARIWIEAGSVAKTAAVKYWKKASRRYEP